MKPKLFVEVKQRVGITFRTPTPAELKATKQLARRIKVADRAYNEAEATLAKLRQSCPHTVFVDSPGHLYDLRNCHACGELLGMI